MKINCSPNNLIQNRTVKTVVGHRVLIIRGIPPPVRKAKRMVKLPIPHNLIRTLSPAPPHPPQARSQAPSVSPQRKLFTHPPLYQQHRPLSHAIGRNEATPSPQLGTSLRVSRLRDSPTTNLPICQTRSCVARYQLQNLLFLSQDGLILPESPKRWIHRNFKTKYPTPVHGWERCAMKWAASSSDRKTLSTSSSLDC